MALYLIAVAWFGFALGFIAAAMLSRRAKSPPPPSRDARGRFMSRRAK